VCQCGRRNGNGTRVGDEASAPSELGEEGRFERHGRLGDPWVSGTCFRVLRCDFGTEWSGMEVMIASYHSAGGFCHGRALYLQLIVIC
jgi:hypothetical protein